MMPLERTGAFTLACVAILLVVGLAMAQRHDDANPPLLLHGRSAYL
jgi:hypothetical protein